MENRQNPSVKNLQCPHCKGTEFKILGTKGSTGKAVGAFLFGAIKNLNQYPLKLRKMSSLTSRVRWCCTGCQALWVWRFCSRSF